MRLNETAICDSGEPENPDVPGPKELLEFHGDELFSFARNRVRDSEVAEELVQETLLNAVRSLDRFRGEASVKTWLFQILRNQISTWYRNEAKKRQRFDSRQPVEMGELLEPKISNMDFQTALQRQEFWEMIDRCCAEIPTHLLDAFLSKLDLPDKSVEELAEEIGITASNYSVRVFRARLLLRKCIESNW